MVAVGTYGVYVNTPPPKKKGSFFMAPDSAPTPINSAGVQGVANVLSWMAQPPPMALPRILTHPFRVLRENTRTTIHELIRARYFERFDSSFPIGKGSQINFH